MSSPSADDTLAALLAGQVDTLLLDPTWSTGTRASFGPDPAQGGSSPEFLRAAGVTDAQPAPLVDVAVRAAGVTVAAVRIVPAGTPELAPGGIGAPLRYR